QRIALTMRLDDVPGTQPSRNSGSGGGGSSGSGGQRDRRPQRDQRPANREPQPMGAMAAAFAKLKR
ncbi:MAG TPA: hypothetical protein VNS57_04215, partial [Steroidobacteraceae bacterium]|nr:hypothetical protein [Steroidobacteraceae bacterium]